MFTSTYDSTECTFNRGLDIYDETSETWVTHTIVTPPDPYPWITGVNTATYAFNIVTEDHLTYDNENIDPTVFQVRLWVEDPNSVTTSPKVYDYFDITLKY